MMPKVKVTKTSRIQSAQQNFSEAFMKSPNYKLCCNLWSCTVSCSKRFLVESHLNRPTSKHQTARRRRFELLIPHISQTFSRSSNTDLVEKVTMASLSADTPLCKLTITHIKSILHNIGPSLLSETTCGKAVLQLSTDELQRVRNAVHCKQFFSLFMRAFYRLYNI